jgi:hypothetical protein
VCVKPTTLFFTCCASFVLCLTYMPTGVLNGGVPVDVGELAQAEPVVVLVGRVGEPVNDDGMVVGMVHLTHPRVQLVVGDRGPVHWLLGHITSIVRHIIDKME